MTQRTIIEQVLATADDDGFASFLHLSHREVKQLAAEIRALQSQPREHVAALVAEGWREELWGLHGEARRVLVAPKAGE